MRKNILAVCVLLLGLCAVLLLRSKLHPRNEVPTSNLPQLRYKPQPETTQSAFGVGNVRSTTNERVVVAVPATSDSSTSFDPEVLAHWRVPIDFYGKVLDESNNPLGGAQIRFQWLDAPSDDGIRNETAHSDSDGLFSLQGKRGPSLSVWVSKEGYYPSHGGQWGFKYGPFASPPFSPDPKNPVVFRLRKKGQGVELITSANGVRPNLAVRVPKDSTPVRVDLFQKQTNATGELEVRQSKPAWREATEWSFSMSITDGGFLENDDEFQFEAPETNYQSRVLYRFIKGETNWTTHFTKSFYIALGRPRKYGWLRLESDLAQETIFLTYAFNPSGSRNLEPASQSQ